MNINDNNKYQLIDDYLSGGMTQKDIDSFKAFMQSDKDLAYDMNVVAEMQEASSFNVLENQLRDTLANIRTERTATDSSPKETTKTNPYKYLAFALVFAGLLFVMYSALGSNKNSNNKIEFQHLAMVEPLQLTTKSDLSLAEHREMQDLYNAANYKEALPMIESYLSTNPRDLDVLIAQGISFSELGRYNEAHTVFGTIKSLNPRVNKYLWYDAITYLKEGNQIEAKKLLEELSSSKGYNYKKALELLASF